MAAARTDPPGPRPVEFRDGLRDPHDKSGELWADLENIINDIMAEAEDRLTRKKQRVKTVRVEVEFVTLFCREMIAGDRYYRPLEKFMQQADEWCKRVRFHKDFVMLWKLWGA